MQINQMENIKNVGLNMSGNNKQLNGNIFLWILCLAFYKYDFFQVCN